MLQSLCRGCKQVAVIVICGCGESPASLCRRCLQGHLEAHQSVPPLPMFNPENVLCQLCKRSPSDLVCPCALPPTALCRDCLSSHIAKMPEELHTCLPVQALPYIRSLRYSKDLNDRKDRIATAKTAFKRNEDRLNEAEATIESTFKSVYESLTEQELKLRRSVMSARETLMQMQRDSLGLIEGRVFDTAFAPADPVSTVILTSNKLETDLDLISVVTQSIATPDLTEFLTVTVTVPENPEYVPQCLAKVSPLNVRLFDCVTESWREGLSLSSSVDCDNGTPVCFTDAKTLFVCGRFRPTTASACFLDLNSGAVTVTNKMREKRGQHGLIHVNGTVYVFGGFTDRKVYLASCEKYDISQRAWFPLPSLANEKNSFTPVLHTTKIYLTSGRIPPTTEVFDIATETIAPFPVSLPRPHRRMPGDFGTCSFLDHGDLVVLRTEEEYRVSVTGQGGVRTRRGEAFSPWSNSTPVVVQGAVFVINYKQKTVASYEDGRWRRMDSVAR